MDECNCDGNGLCDSCWRKIYAERPLGSRAIESGVPHAWDKWDEEDESSEGGLATEFSGDKE